VVNLQHSISPLQTFAQVEVFKILTMFIHVCSLLFLPSIALALPSVVLDKDNAIAESRSLTADEMHANVMRAWDPDRVILSTDLDTLAAASPEAVGSTVYLPDRRTFVELTRRNVTLAERESCHTDAPERKVLRSQVIWDPWQPLTSCLHTGKDPSGGSTAFSVSVSKGTTIDVG